MLAFAEGRFLTVHPFRDFNGRTIRVFLLELLRRLDLPRVELAPQTETGRAAYFAAFHALRDQAAAAQIDFGVELEPAGADLVWGSKGTTPPPL